MKLPLRILKLWDVLLDSIMNCSARFAFLVGSSSGVQDVCILCTAVSASVVTSETIFPSFLALCYLLMATITHLAQQIHFLFSELSN
jgi:hypothetical protein